MEIAQFQRRLRLASLALVPWCAFACGPSTTAQVADPEAGIKAAPIQIKSYSQLVEPLAGLDEPDPILKLARSLHQWRNEEGYGLGRGTPSNRDLGAVQPILNGATELRPQVAFRLGITSVSDFDAGFKQVAELELLANILVQDAVRQAKKSDDETAYKRLEAANNIRYRLGMAEPSVGIALAQASISGRVIQGALEVRKITDNNDDVRNQALLTIFEMGPAIDFKRAMQGEYALICDKKWKGSLEADDANVSLRTDSRSIEALEVQLEELINNLPVLPVQLSPQVSALDAAEERLKIVSAAEAPFVNSRMNQYLSAGYAVAETEARIAAATVALTAEPSQLASRDASTLPSDPFARARLKVIVSNQSHVVYSVGKNQRDDGGDDVLDIPVRIEYRSTRRGH